MNIRSSNPSYLDTSIGKVDPVRACNISSQVLSLRLLKVGPGERVPYPVLVPERLEGGWWCSRGAVGLGSSQCNGDDSAENDGLEWKIIYRMKPSRECNTNCHIFLKKWPNPRLFNYLFSFQTNIITNFTTN